MQKNTFYITLIFVWLMLFSQRAYSEFTALDNFNDNPGELTASMYRSDKASKHLVVLLHGCTQNGERLAEQSGLLALAKKKNFSLLIPQQSLNNNIKQCFNWYSPQDTSLDSGELLSIKNMLLTSKQVLDAEFVYVIGLSAGGAMASAMLVNYPELFTSAAIVAGIAFPCADGLIKAISCMKNGPSQSAAELISLAKQHHKGEVSWPNLSIWTGNQDSVVHPKNAEALAQQWLGLMAITSAAQVNEYPEYRVSQWQKEHSTQVQLVQFEGLGHGMMVDKNSERGDAAIDFLLPAPISTVKTVVDFWQIQ